MICPTPHIWQVAGPCPFYFTYTHFMDGKIELLFYIETCSGGPWPHEEFLLYVNIPVIC